MPRISKVAYCCELKYSRWRLADRPFPAGHVQCCRCGEKLHWRPSGDKRAVWLRSYYRRRFQFLAQGLTAQGKQRQRRPNLAPRERAANHRRLSLQSYRRRAQHNLAMGLTTRGSPRKASWFERPANPAEIAWRQFRENLNLPNTEILCPLER